MASSSQELILQKADAATLIVHPLVLLNISDHHTRQKVRSRTSNPRVIGALLGQQRAKAVELFNSFELLYDLDPDTNAPVLDVEFLRERKAQFKQNFEKLDLIGWYSTGSLVGAAEVAVQRQLFSETDGEANIFIMLDTLATAVSTRDLPLATFEAELKLNPDQSSSVFFTKLPLRVDTGDSERVAVDYVARARPVGADESPTVEHLSRLQNAIRMLFDRVSTVKAYLEAVTRGEITQVDYNLLRQIQNLVSMLPTMSTDEFKQESMTEYNDSLVQTYLAAVTKGSHAINELVDHYNVAYDRNARIGMRFGGLQQRTDFSTVPRFSRP